MVVSLLILSPWLQAQTPAPPPPVPFVKPAKQPPTDQPGESHEFYVAKRAGPGARHLPYEKYAAAASKADRMRRFSLARNRFRDSKERAATIDLGGWESLGPGNQGGRTRALLIHPTNPSILYSGAATGGVWKSTDAGNSWQPLTDTFPALGIGALAFDPANPDVLYAGTGFWFNSLSVSNVLGSAPRGVGIFRSRDAGLTWERLPQPDGTHFRYINEIIVSRHNSSRLYAATWTGIFRSNDAGQTWRQIVDRGVGAQNGCQDMVARPDTGTDYLYATCGTSPAAGPVILRKENAAEDGAWQVVHSNPAAGHTTLALAPSSPSTIYALSASNGSDNPQWDASLLGLWRSTANGDPGTWEARVQNTDPERLNTSLLSNNQSFFFDTCFGFPRSINGQGWIHNALAVDPQDPDRVFAGGIDIYRSDDGGRTWGIASFWQAADGPNGAHADILNFAFPPDYDGTTRPFLYAATDGGVYLTENARDELATGPRAACQPFQNRVRWRPLHGGLQTTQFYTGAVLPGGGAFFGGKQDNGTMRGTLAATASWERLFGGDGASVAIDPRDANTIYFSTPQLGFNRSRDGGLTSQIITRGIVEPSGNFLFIPPLTLDQRNPDRLYTGARNLYRSDDQGSLWTRATSTILDTSDGQISAIAVAPSDSARVLFATSLGSIFRPTAPGDGQPGTTWDSVRPRPGYIAALAFDPRNADIAYAVYSQFLTAPGQHHVYKTTDGGRTWEGIDREGATGIPDMPVLAVTVDPENSNRVYLGTDLGVFVSLDAGGSWARDESPFASVPTEALRIDRGSGATFLYAFTFGRGVWRTRLPGTGTPCRYELLGELPAPFPAFGGAAPLRVDTGEGCVWSAVGQGPVALQSPPTGTGPGTVRLAVPLNISTAARPIAVSLQDRTVTGRQAGAVPINALEADALESPLEITLPFAGISDTRRATSSGVTDKQASCTTVPPAKTLWLRVTPAESGLLDVFLQGRRYDVAGNSGVIVTAYAADGNATGPELGCAVVARDQAPWRFGNFSIDVTGGVTYLLQVGALGDNPADGGFTIIGVNLRRP